MRKLEFTGERYVPGTKGLEELYIEHMSRYVFASDLAQNSNILDVGCGCGYGTHYLALSGAKVVLGVDHCEEAVQYARMRYRHPCLYFAVMDVHELAFKACFDLVTCFEVIEHVNEALEMVRRIYDVLDDSGIFLASTPNTLTYIAGGEGGANPFHVREYTRDEFEDLLRSVFPHTHIFGQYWIEGIGVGPYPEPHAPISIRSRKLPDESGVVEERLATGEPPYFIAACAKRDILKSACLRISPVVTHSLVTRYDRLKQYVTELQEEFDERGRWALGLEQEKHKRDKTIKELQNEMLSLREQNLRLQELVASGLHTR